MPLLSTSPSPKLLAKRKRDPAGTPEPPPTERHFPSSPRKRKILRIEIPSLNISQRAPPSPSTHDDPSSLFSGLSEPNSLFDEPTSLTISTTETSPVICTRQLIPALLTAPLIPGLFFTPTLRLPQDIAEDVTRFCLNSYFQKQGVNQVMLFGRLSTEGEASDNAPALPSPTGLPPILLSLLSTLDKLLLPSLPPRTHALLFPRVPERARQAILNLYQPGEGISPHVDLLKRFDDGIVGVSLGSGCVMQFAKVDVGDQPGGGGRTDGKRWDLYLPERSIIVLSEDARYGWTHGIGRHTEDYVTLPGLDDSNGQWIERGVRLSITFRWLLPGADVVGEDEH